MRLLELDVHNIRGICDLTLKPGGKNFVAWGPNGSGKSALVDAIDFLLTGRIARLIGKGTGGITLSEHGPHIDDSACCDSTGRIKTTNRNKTLHGQSQQIRI